MVGCSRQRRRHKNARAFPPRSPACDWAIDLSRGNAIPLGSDRRYKYSRVHVLFTKKKSKQSWNLDLLSYYVFYPSGNPFDRECYPETTCFSNQITNLISNTTILRCVSSFFFTDGVCPSAILDASITTVLGDEAMFEFVSEKLSLQ